MPTLSLVVEVDMLLLLLLLTGSKLGGYVISLGILALQAVDKSQNVRPVEKKVQSLMFYIQRWSRVS